MAPRIIIAVGGTGGHIYPAIAVAQELQDKAEIMVVGGGLSSNPYFCQKLLPHKNIACGSLSPRKPLASLINSGKIAFGIAQSYQLIKQWRPSLLIGFGSYHSLPVLIGARLANVPYILHEQNSVLGRVNRFMAKKAEFIGAFFPEVAMGNGRLVEVEMPLRKDYKKGMCLKTEAKSYFGLDSAMPVILIFGGSQGAQTLNQEFARRVEASSRRHFSILHLTGSQASAIEIRQRYEKCNVSACVKDFEPRMNLAWEAADLLVSRSGAGTIAEQFEFEVPGILVPYPYAMDNHQETNADHMCLRVRGAAKLIEKEFHTRNVLDEALEMLNEKNLLSRKQAIIEYKQTHKPHDFCTLIMDWLYDTSCIN